MNQSKVAGPTIKGVIKKARASGYTFEKALGDILDGGITMEDTTEVTIQIESSSQNTNLIKRIIISDNNEKGMYKLQFSGTQHPLCWTHTTNDHDNDECISEYGSGMKAAAVNLASEMTIITKYKKPNSDNFEYKYIKCNWDKMNSFDPSEDRSTYNNIDYKNDHIYNNGTSIILEYVINNHISLYSIQKNIYQYLSVTYYKYLKKNNLIININGTLTKVSPSIPPTECYNPWGIYSYDIVKLINGKTPDLFIYKNISKKKSHWYKCFMENGKFKTISLNKKTYEYLMNESKVDYKLSFKGCKCQGLKNDPKNKSGSIVMARYNRVLTDNSQLITFGPHVTNGEQNHNYYKLDWKSKKINKDLKISYSKSISVPFPDNLLTKTLTEVYKKLKSDCGGNTKHNDDWLKITNSQWRSKLNFIGNIKYIYYQKKYFILCLIKKYIKQRMKYKALPTPQRSP